MRPFMYGRDSLYALRKQVINNKSIKIKQSTWCVMKELNIARTRGCRAGKRKQRHIPVVVTNRQNIFSDRTCSQAKNLINVKLSGAQTHKRKPACILKSRIGTWNAQHITNKASDVCDLILNYRLDVLAITESWLKGDQSDHCVLADITSTMPDFKIHQLPRSNGKSGGGICVIFYNWRL